MSTQISGTSGVIFPDSSTQNTAATGFGFKNRIINGAMIIDQRNAGGAVNISATQAYFTDRFSINCTGSITGQQVVDAPTGYIYSLKGTVNASTLRATVFQRIEANNLSDAIAGAVTVSFWAKSNKTGVRSMNYTLTDSSTVAKVTYIAEFNITIANTWQQFSVSIPAPSTLTGVNTYGNAVCAQLAFIFSKDGSPSVGTVGSWNSSTPDPYGVSTNQIAMASGNTFYITGVQLEKGSTATSFDYRPYGTELALCQRYFSIARGLRVSGYQTANEEISCYVGYPVAMRAAPTVATFVAGGLGNANGPIYVNPSYTGYAFKGTAVATGSVFVYDWTSSQSAEL